MEYTIEQIDEKLTELRKELENVKGTETEVHARIVGYYRVITNWNNGKAEEYRHRKVYNPKSEIKEHKANTCIYFYQPSCPNCVPVKKYLDDTGVEYSAINAMEHQDEAQRYNIMSTPTFIILDENKIERHRFHTVDQIKKVIE